MYFASIVPRLLRLFKRMVLHIIDLRVYYMQMSLFKAIYRVLNVRLMIDYVINLKICRFQELLIIEPF